MRNRMADFSALAAVLRRTAAVVVALLLVAALSACGSRPGPHTLDPRIADVPGARIVTIYVATSRERAASGVNRFTDATSASLNFAVYRVSIPPTHKAGQIEYPGEDPNPKTEFTVVDEKPLDKASFLQSVDQASSGGKGDISVFVHGFNTNLPEAVFRNAQLAADSREGNHDVSILFAWPSTAAYSGYLADKAAATASRDQLTELLTLATKERPGGRVLVAAHSMGGWLLMEALRQLKLTGRQGVLDRLKVILAAPDIDGMVFLAQMRSIGRMHEPMTILVSKSDIALSISSFLSRDQIRVGLINIADPQVQEGAKAYNIQLIDISEVKTDDPFGHNGFASLAALAPSVRNRQDTHDPIPLNKAGVFVFDAVGRTLLAPLTIGKKLTAR